jgi:hypothetical protein
MSPVSAGTAYVDILPDMKRFGADFKTKVSREVASAGEPIGRKFGSSFALGVTGALSVIGGQQIASFFMGSIQAASELNESLSKSNNVFRQSGAVIEEWARGGAKNFGLSTQAALEAASTFGNMFAQLGIGSEQAAEMSTSMVELAADFASFHNADITDVIAAQSSAFRGEYDALQRFLPLLSAATVEQRALALTGKASTKELTAQDKALAVNALMFEGAGDAAGDFDRTADSLANQQRTLNAEWDNAKTALGENLMPVLNDFVGFLNENLIPAFRDLFSLGGEGESWGASIADFFSDVIGFALAGFADLGRLIANFVDAIPGNIGATFVADSRAFADEIDALRPKFHATTKEINDYTEQVYDVDDANRFLKSSTQAAVGPITALGNATGDTADKYEELAEAVTKARRSLAGAHRDLEDARRGEKEAQADYDEAVRAAEAMGNTDTALEAVADAHENLLDAKDLVADATDRVADAEEAVQDADAKLIAKTPAVVAAMGQREDAAKGVADELARIVGLSTEIGNFSYVNMAGAPTGGPMSPTSPQLPLGAPSIPSATQAGGGLLTGAPITVNVTQPNATADQIAKEIMWNTPGGARAM